MQATNRVALALALFASLSACKSGSKSSDPAPQLALSTASLSFSATQGGPNPASQAVSVSNGGGGQLAAPSTSIAYTSGSGWLTATVGGASAPFSVTVQPATAGLTPGTYQATITVSSEGATSSPATVGVTFTVSAPTTPTIGLSPAQLSFEGMQGAPSPPNQTVSVSNLAPSTGSLAAPTTTISYGGGSGSWLSVTVSGASAPYTLTVSATTGALTAGTYTADVSVACAGASNTPQTLPVTFRVLPTCKAETVACGGDGECCSGKCDDTSSTCTVQAFCESAGAPCTNDNDCCTQNCVGAGAPGATCGTTACLVTGATCSGGSQCCSGTCDGTNQCAALPTGGISSCKTLGETCAGPLECCSKTCQGGVCAPAYSCNATGDICYRTEDCCSGLCTATGGNPGRCDAPSGGCRQDGIPCDNASNCCTRLCVDLGSGTKVCQPAAGCRMTGDYCDSTAACCGGTDPANPTGPSPYGVYCDGLSTSGGPPEYDPSSKNDHTCSGGQSCNPPGNICGGSGATNASQNCCNGKKDVCKADSNGIMRCFGGPPGHCSNNGCDATCPTGWNADDPSCCIPLGDVCQFRDQCCNRAPCVPDEAGDLRCTAPPDACLPRDTECVPQTSPACCEGTTCQAVEGGNFCREPAGSCSGTGVGCSAPAECCSGVCASGFCAECAPNGNTCATDSQCCSGLCDATGHCATPCVGASGSCTAPTDCCAGLSCDIPAGQTSGTCTSGSTCSTLGQACDVSSPCCDGNGTCTDGVCANVCSGLSQQCTITADCCTPLECRQLAAGGGYEPCAAGPCTCEATSCVANDAACSAGGAPCCNSTYTCTDDANTLFPCSAGSAGCHCTVDPGGGG